MQKYISAAFHAIAPNANTPFPYAVTLYVSVPYYGGPEEGGWYGRDVKVVAWSEYPSEWAANAAAAQMAEKAREMSETATRAHGEQCNREMEWCDARGLDYDYLPEPDGPETYFTKVEPVARIGREVSTGSRQYE